MPKTKVIQKIEKVTDSMWDCSGGAPISQNILLKEINNGNKKAFKYLYTRYYNELCIFANGFTKDSYLAEDIVQNVMVSLWEKKKTLTINISVKSYLYKCVYNQFINYCRKIKKEISLKQEIKATTLINFAEDDESITNKKIKLINTEIENLPKRCKEVFIMSKRQGMKYKEISEELSISIKTVEAHISKALKQINLKIKKV